MTFNSLQFIVFFILVTLWFFRLKNQKGRIWLLLIASCYFYMSFIPEYILILGGTIVVDYFAGILIEKSTADKRKFWLIVSLVANIGTLAVFKYYNFFISDVYNRFLYSGTHLSLPLLKIALPIGLSFHTFQAMSYTIEVYRGKQASEKNFIIYALYVMFYPQLVTGPIERPQNIFPQLKQFQPYNWDNVKEGIARMLWGFFKKAVIADRLAIVVDRTFTHTTESSSLALLTGAVFFLLEIYCDFSGYTDIAIGAAKVINIKLMENFNQPLLSGSLNEFWTRWHISLTSWFRDYVYIPMGGNRKGKIRRVLNIMLIFFLSGLWHGANWTFIVWGLLHGIFLIIETSAGIHRIVIRSSLLSIFRIIINFSLLVFLTIFFRADTIHSAWHYIRQIFMLKGGSDYIGINMVEFFFSILVVVIMFFKEKLLPGHFISSNRFFYLYSTFMVLVVYFFGVFMENQFIYFQF